MLLEGEEEELVQLAHTSLARAACDFGKAESVPHFTRPNGN